MCRGRRVLSKPDAVSRLMKKRAKRAVDTGDMCRGRRVLSKPDAVSRLMKKRAKRAMGTGDMCRRRRVLSKPDAVSRLMKKRAKRAMGTGDMCRGRRVLSKPDAVYPPMKKLPCKIINENFIFLQKRVGECHSPTRFFYRPGNCIRLRGNAPISTHAPGSHRALGALFPRNGYPVQTNPRQMRRAVCYAFARNCRDIFQRIENVK